MKTIYRFKHFVVVIALLLMGMNVFSQVTTTIANVTNNGTGVYPVDVTVTNFNNVGNISLVMEYDSTKLIYSGISLNSGIVAKAVVTAPYDVHGKIRLTYISTASDPAIVLSGSTLFTVTFTAKTDVTSGAILPSVLGTLQALNWSTHQGEKEYAQVDGTVLSGSVFNNGSIAIPPVPTIMFNGQDISNPLYTYTVSGGTTAGQVFTTEANKTGYVWSVGPQGTITAGQGSNSVTVDWINPTRQQNISVTYSSAGIPALSPTVDIINYYPFANAIVPTTIPQFVDPVPHFAAGLRIDAKTVNDLTVKAVKIQQVALSTGTVVSNGTIGTTPGAGVGNYIGYSISTDNGNTFIPASWPARTIETMQGHQLRVHYVNGLLNASYDDFNILADQTLLMNGFTLNGDPLLDPYRGPIPMVVHLHGGEMPSNSDGGPTAWFMPEGYSGSANKTGPGFPAETSQICTYPNQQEGTTLWYHPHDQGLTRINVYTGQAGFYFLRGTNEDQMHLPGWSGDDKVLEVTPAGKTTTFNAVPYLPEIELAIQDRMFNTKGELYWPVTPTNPDAHPFWTPEFFGDVMTVNGKSWPYLSVAPRKYTFRMLNGCNARFLDMWLKNLADNTNGPKITVVSTEGGFMNTPTELAPGQKLFIAPAERPIVVIDFSGVPAGTVFTLMNDANAPYPTGDPVVPGLTDRIMQFVVNGQMVHADGTPGGTDLSANITSSTNLRPIDPMIKLTNFDGTENVVPTVKRQLILNEITGAGGPLRVAINNSHFDNATPAPGEPYSFGGPTETPREGTIEEWKIINTTVDAHPMHIHLTQWQLVSRQTFDKVAFMAAYAAAWDNNNRGVPNFPSFAPYPGGAGSPNDYNTPNKDGALGGNPAISDFLIGQPRLPLPEERGWKDAIKALPGDDNLGQGEVSTYLCRMAPTSLPLNTPEPQLVYPFDPSLGPGYVWHCHIIDHEDMDMMRPMPIIPNPSRFPQISTQPVPYVACAGDVATFSVVASSATAMTYQWQVNVNGVNPWTNITNGAPSPYSNATTATLRISPATSGLTTNQYRCIITNVDGSTTSSEVALTVNNCTISGTVKYNNANQDLLAGMTVIANNKQAVVDGSGNYVITGVVSGNQNVTVTPGSSYFAGSINSTDAGAANYWFAHQTAIPYVKFLAGDVNGNGSINAGDALGIQLNFVNGQSFNRNPWVFWNAATTVSANPITNPMDPCKVVVAGQSVVLNLLGQVTGDFNGSLNPLAPKSATSSLDLTNVETLKLGANQNIDLPIVAASAMQVGAVSLILNIPSDLVEVKDVLISGNNSKVSYNVNGNELRIGWNSLTPVSVQAASNFIILKLKTTSAFTEGKTIKIKLVSNPLNEIADGSFKPIPQAIINIDAILAVNNNPALVSLNCYPNPFSGSTTLSYSLPVDASVTLQIYNLLGVAVKTIVSEKQSAGTYTVRMDASKMQPGAYYATLRVNDGSKIVERTVKLVMNK